MADGSERTSTLMNEPTRGAADADAIPEAVREVIALYEARPELRFPDVDHQVLERHCEAVREGVDEVARAHAVLEEARRVQDERQAALWTCARRAFAYAQVYAEGEPELSSELEQMKLTRSSGASSSKKKRATRKPKAPKNAAAREQASELPFEAETSSTESTVAPST